MLIAPRKIFRVNVKINLLRERIKSLETTVAQLQNENYLLVEKLEKGYERLKSMVNTSMGGWNGGSL